MNQAALLMPVFVLILWTFIITLIMAYGRVRFTKNPQKDAAHTRDLKGLLPAWVERTSDNYNHLFEQPTVFYAISFVIWGLNHTDSIHLYCAWTYVVIRIIHSILQATINLVWFRFSLFILSWIALSIMIFREALMII